ncbi:MAG TPA: 4-(cytidine 5'-diphospho)-2-C-methyl-D-erythritol kinase [Deltaproteobacteria bacterium]|nr:4-(cytidine 5'-diphospho)-2-C-methyl-D-erythritol kinase [Deltaproteobacteria bacterium]HPJ93606.1 4-(cytidine 5'-diphospho)-2-C-methyl-D-erythritol kinase [Deltaproteobacteria bacterium]HPR50979.1 4-(cytidine 5'-diphospho)-2-C-methyl-D-erythritol kinase [Deltaproteobacteria bacterium]
MNIQAPAKINIYLKVVGRREDGYHELRTIMVPISLFDEIILEPADAGIHLDAPGCNCADADNLVYKAAALFFEYTGKPPGISIRVNKHIPIGAGLGGGSSDASSVLLGLNDLFQTNLSTGDLMALAARLGADCPFFILRRPLLMGSRGDEVIQEVSLHEREYLLVIPPYSLSTAQVYAEVKSPLTPDVVRFTIDNKGYNVIAPEQWLENDLEAAAFGICPELKLIKSELINAGALGVLMSGSGSSVFGVFKDRDHLCNGLSRLERHDGYSYIPTTTLTGERYGNNRG